MPNVPDDKPLLRSLGASGVAIFSGIITSEEYNPDFYWRDGIKIYEQMLRSDGQIRAMRMVVENPIKRAIWSIEPGSEAPRDKEIASFVESCLFHDMRYTTATGRQRHQSWSQILHHILMHLWYGFMTFEIDWRIEDGWVKWAKWEPLLPRTIWRWWVGPDTELEGVQQWTFKDYNYAFTDIPADKLLLFAHQQEGANFEGLSLLRTAYKHWWYKQNFEKIEAIGIERNAVVPPIITLPNNFTNADVAAAQTLGANMRASELGYATLPPGWLLDYPAHMQPFTAQVQPAIQYHDVMIARNVLAQFINLGSTETGAYALAEAQQEMFLEALEAVTDYICDTINADAIQRLVDYNYDNVEVYPRLRASALANADITQLADAVSKLKARDANFLTPDPEMEDYLREQMHFPKAPRSVVQATNPTSEATADRPENANASDHSDQQSAVEKANPQTATNQSQQSEATAANNAIAPAAPGDGGALSDGLGADVRLLREAVASIAGLDAVERGMRFFNPNHDSRGRFAAGGGGGSTGAPKAKGAAAKAPKANNGNKGKAGVARGGAAKAAAGGAQAAKAAGQPRGKVVNMQRVHERQEAKKARLAAKQDEYNRIHAEKLKAAKEEHEAAQAHAKQMHAEIQPKLDAIGQRYNAVVAQHGYNHPEAKQLEREAAKEAKPLNAAYLRLGKAALVQGRLELEGPKQAAKPAPKTIDVHVESRRLEAEARARSAAQHAADAHAQAEAIRKADNGIVRAENGKWAGETAEQPPFSVQQFEHANLVSLGGKAGINDSYTATINGQKYLIKRTEMRNALSNGHPGIADVTNAERYETHAEAASPRIAEAMGLGGHSITGYAFEHNEQQYVAVPWHAGMRTLYDSPQGFNRAASESDLRSLALHEYIVGEVDRHQGNYIFNSKTGETYTIDHGRSLRNESAKPEDDSAGLEAWARKAAGAGAGVYGSTPGHMRFDAAQLRSITAREPEVLRIMRQYKLDAGIPGVQRRFEALRQLSSRPNPSLADLQHIGSVIDKRDGV